MASKKLLIAVLTAILFSSTLSVCLSEDSEASSYDYSYDLGDYVGTTSSNATSVTISGSGSDIKYAYLEIITSSYGQGKLTIDSSNAPTWFTVSVDSTKIVFTIAYGSVCSGTYYHLFNCDGFGVIQMYAGITVTDSGSVIPDGSNTFVLSFDTDGGSSVSSITVSSDESSHTFDISDVDVPVKSGYTFKGWSEDSDRSSILTVSTVSVDADETVTLYAVWEKTSIVWPSVWSEFAEVLSDPAVILVLVILFLAVCLFIRHRLEGLVR